MVVDHSTNPPICPACERVLQNRLIDVCQYCGQSLPPELLLGAVEKHALEELMRSKAREELRRMREAEHQPPQSDLDFPTISIDFTHPS